MDKIFKRKKNYLIALVILLFSLILFILFMIFFKNIKDISNVCSSINSKNIKIDDLSIKAEVDKLEVKDVLWYISIPKINLSRATISEGTEDIVLENYVGHFNESAVFYGNVCLAAHNRGHVANYFENLKLLEVGDEIIYNSEYGRKIYEVESKSIIDVYDFSCVENTDRNCITLITCVEYDPNKRLFVRGVERSI